MKWLLMYSAFIYVVFCADDVSDWDDNHKFGIRSLRALFWPVTVTNWFRKQNIRVHRLLTILWIILVSGWLLSLINDHT